MADTSKRSAAKKSTSRSRNNQSQDNPEIQASDEVRTAIISGVTFGTKAVQYAVVDGRAIFEGDIDLGSVEELEKSNDAMRGLTIEEAVVHLRQPVPVARRRRALRHRPGDARPAAGARRDRALGGRTP